MALVEIDGPFRSASYSSLPVACAVRADNLEEFQVQERLRLSAVDADDTGDGVNAAHTRTANDADKENRQQQHQPKKQKPLLVMEQAVIRHYGTLEIRVLSGRVIATYMVRSPEETVGGLRHRLRRDTPDELGGEYAHTLFLHGDIVLADYRRLIELVHPDNILRTSGFDGAPKLVCLTMITSRPSMLAEHLAANDLDCACCMDVADAVFQAEHTLSVRHQPTAVDIARGISLDKRAEIVDWLSAVLPAYGVSDDIKHGVMLTLDRFCALQRTRIDASQHLRLSLAAVANQMKLATEEDYPYGLWQRVVSRIAGGRVSLSDIYSAERIVLVELDFQVELPSTLTFLKALGLRLSSNSETGALQKLLAQFFLEMALYDVYLQYRFPLVVLAASALGAAQFATSSFNPEAHSVLMDDLASYCPYLPEVCLLERKCEELILEMWVACCRGTSIVAPGNFKSLCERHLRRETRQDLRSAFQEALTRKAQTALDAFRACRT
jgi:hypothetical protein